MSAEWILKKRERQRLYQLEQRIEHGLSSFVEVGSALMEIRDKMLYCELYPLFEDYCEARWGFKHSHSYRLIRGAMIVNHLKSSPTGEVLPITEAQARPLATLMHERKKEGIRVIDMGPVGDVWEHVVAEAPPEKDGRPHITEKLVRRAVNDWREEHGTARKGGKPARSPYSVSLNDLKAYWEKASERTQRDFVIWATGEIEAYDAELV